jgi:hypothetical protein
MKLKLLAFTLFYCLAGNVFSQKILRQSIASIGNSSTNDNCVINVTIGQSYYNNSLRTSDGNIVRPGFQQPNYKGLMDNKLNLKIYPIPTSSVLNLEFEHDVSNAKYWVYDLFGKLLFSSQSFNSRNSVLNCHHFPSGAYILFVQADNYQASSFKFMVY